MIRTWRGKTPKVHPTAFISEAAYIVGDVEIGAYSSVWPGAVIRAEARLVIGHHTNIQDGSIVHADEETELGNYITIGHNVVFHGKRVADYCLLGNSSVVLEKVEVGDHSLIASGAVVLYGSKIPPRSLVAGVPASIKGQTNQHQEWVITATVEEVWRKGQEYKQEGLGETIMPGSQP
ncbi:MAG: gamma carbonic anhydrase family protein [Chloroflexi bacterium]|nr:gamma carbonic anhydrase family protein [Chloroflexota bacterium]